MLRPTCRRIILAGTSYASLAPFSEMLQASCASRITISHNSAFAVARAVDADADAEQILVTSDFRDALRLKKMRDWSPEERAATQVVLVIRDPRDLLLAQVDWAGGSYSQGYDHALHRSANDLVTLTDLGALFLQETVERMASRDPTILVLRHEDIEARQPLVRAALSGLTGLDFTRPYDTDTVLGWPAAATGFRKRYADGSLKPADQARLARQFRLAPELFGILDRWDYEAPGDRRWHADMERQSPESLDDTPGLIVGYHTTDPLYETEARRMRASVDRLKLPLELEALPRAQNWLSGVQMKPAFLADARRRLRGPLLYVDVDAVIHSDPWPYLRGYDGDIAIAGHHGEAILSGTVLINDTPAAQSFLDEWVEEQTSSPGAWDQVCLEAVAKRHRLNDEGVTIQYLPPEMCCVFNRKFNPPITAAIEHLQASREQFVDAKDDGLVRNLDARRQRLAELEAAEELTTSPAHAPVPYADLTPVERRQSTQRLVRSAQSDRDRWAHSQNLKANWSSRAEVVAGLIDPGLRVLDIGCGAMDLERALPDRCQYIPADIVTRDDRTIIVDLNTERLPDVQADVVTLLGVLEYIHEPEALLRALAERFPRVVMTYNPSDLDIGRDRQIHGWFNSLTTASLVATAARAGYRLEMIVPHGARERVFQFTSQAASPCR